MSKRLFHLFAVLVLVGSFAATDTVAERAEKTLEFSEIIPVGGSIDVENLLGDVIIRGGTDHRTARIEARVVADAKTQEDAQALVDAIRLDSTQQEQDHSIRIVFPVQRHTAFRLPKSERNGVMDKWVSPVVNRDTVAVEYGGRMVRVGNQRGAAAVSVNLIVTLPMDIRASFRQIVGSIHSSASRGDLHLEVIEGKVMADHLYGSLHARSGGGQVEVSSFHGEALGLETSSGDVELAEIETGRARLTTGSGRIQISGITVDDLEVESSTGNVEIDRLQPVALNVSTGSGSIDLEPNFKHTREAAIRSSSGDVTLRVTELASFDLLAETKSGTVNSRGVDLEPHQPRQGANGYRCGVGGPEVHVTAKGGEVTVRAAAAR